MKFMKRFLAVFAALMLLSGSALAQGSAGNLVQAVTSLLKTPGNVTLKGEASFTYDGELFKKLSAVYLREDDLNHYVDVDFWTRGKKGDYQSGYSILALDGIAKAWDKYEHQYESGVSYAERKTLLNEPSMELVLGTLQLFPELAGSLLDPYVTSGEGENVFHISLNGGMLPGEVHDAVREGIRSFLGRYLYVHLMSFEEPEAYHAMEYDFFALASAVYRETYGEEMTEEFWERMSSRGKGTDEEWERYGTVYGKCVTIIGKASQLYDDGYSVLRPDGTLEHFETYAEQQRAMGYVNVYFEEYIATVESMKKAALENGQITQEDLTDKSIYDIAELLGVTAHYQEIGREQNAAIVYVRVDGTYDLYMNEQSFTVAFAPSTVSAIVETMQSYELGDVQMTVTLDGEGRIASAEGTVELVVTDTEKGRHSIQMTFSGNVSGYGDTKLDEVKAEWTALHDAPDTEH